MLVNLFVELPKSKFKSVLGSIVLFETIYPEENGTLNSSVLSQFPAGFQCIISPSAVPSGTGGTENTNS